jgi:hypothetical protein
MKKLVLLVVTLFLIMSCKTSKTSCDAYGKIKESDTIEVSR